MATATLEDVAGASHDPGTLFFQLYVLRDREFTQEIVQVSTRPWHSICILTYVHTLVTYVAAIACYALTHLSPWHVQRAEKAGYAALAVTVDAPRCGSHSCTLSLRQISSKLHGMCMFVLQAPSVTVTILVQARQAGSRCETQVPAPSSDTG